MRDDFSLAWKQSRFEFASLWIVAVALLAGAIYLSVDLGNSTPPGACYPLLNGGPIKGSDVDVCPGLLRFLDLNGWGERVQVLMPATLFLGSALLGSQIVARELDQGTIRLAWSLTGARSRWLAFRLVPVATVLLALAVAFALASTALEQSRHPGLDLSRSFLEYGFWGPVLVFRACTIFFGGVLIGSVAGRVVPSLLLTLVLAAGVVLVMPLAGRALQPPLMASAITSPANEFPLFLETGWLTPEGEFLSNEQAVALAPPGGAAGSAYDWIATHFQTATSYLPGDRLVAVSLQETAADVALALMGLGLTLVVIRRRGAG